MISPCPKHINCPGTDFPFLNNSSESKDVLTFVAINYGYNPPPLEYTFSAAGCVSLCESTISQDDADQCAARQAYLCANGQQPFPPGGPPGGPTPGGSVPPIYFNHPQSCTFNCPDGLPFTFTIGGGLYVGPSQALVDTEALNYACQQAFLHHVCLSAITSECCSGQFFSSTVTASGGGVSATGNLWSITGGTLPIGLQLLSSGGPTAVISGTPSGTGTFIFTVTIVTPTGYSMTKTYSLCVVDISPSSSTLPNAVKGTALSISLSSSSCAIAPYNWQIVSGSLPTGVTIDQSTGQITGTPTSSGTYHFTVKFQDQST